MQESMMIAEVGGIVNVSGSRIATPFAPPRPGSTPMITPRMTPVNISARLVGVSATPKPCISDWISSIALAPPRQPLERALGQRHEEPHREDQEQDDAVADRHRADLPPRVLAQP